MAQQTKGVKLPNLEKFGREITTKSACIAFDPVIARESEIERIVQILSRRTKNNPCLVGKAGVGKTELCKSLAECLFKDKDAIVRLDMSEYMEKQSVSKLIGSPPGYVGYNEGGQIAEKIRRNPYAILLQMK